MASSEYSDEVEEWRDIPGFEGRYQASSFGRIRRLPRWVNGKCNRPSLKGMRIHASAPNKKTGYREAQLVDSEGKSVRTTAHRLVCMAFHGPPPSPEHETAHNDGSRTNNRPENLRWATKQENALDRSEHGTQQRGEDQWLAKLTEDDVRYIRLHYKRGYGGLTPFAEKFGITRAAVLAIVKRRNWKHI